MEKQNNYECMHENSLKSCIMNEVLDNYSFSYFKPQLYDESRKYIPKISQKETEDEYKISQRNTDIDNESLEYINIFDNAKFYESLDARGEEEHKNNQDIGNLSYIHPNNDESNLDWSFSFSDSLVDPLSSEIIANSNDIYCDNSFIIDLPSWDEEEQLLLSNNCHDELCDSLRDNLLEELRVLHEFKGAVLGEYPEYINDIQLKCVRSLRNEELLKMRDFVLNQLHWICHNEKYENVFESLEQKLVKRRTPEHQKIQTQLKTKELKEDLYNEKSDSIIFLENEKSEKQSASFHKKQPQCLKYLNGKSIEEMHELIKKQIELLHALKVKELNEEPKDEKEKWLKYYNYFKGKEIEKLNSLSKNQLAWVYEIVTLKIIEAGNFSKIKKVKLKLEDDPEFLGNSSVMVCSFLGQAQEGLLPAGFIGIEKKVENFRDSSAKILEMSPTMSLITGQEMSPTITEENQKKLPEKKENRRKGGNDRYANFFSFLYRGGKSKGDGYYKNKWEDRLKEILRKQKDDPDKIISIIGSDIIEKLYKSREFYCKKFAKIKKELKEKLYINIDNIEEYTSLYDMKAYINKGEIEHLVSFIIFIILGLKMLPLQDEKSLLQEFKEEHAAFLLWLIESSNMKLENKVILFSLKERKIIHNILMEFQKLISEKVSKEVWKGFEVALEMVQQIGEVNQEVISKFEEALKGLKLQKGIKHMDSSNILEENETLVTNTNTNVSPSSMISENQSFNSVLGKRESRSFLENSAQKDEDFQDQGGKLFKGNPPDK